MRSLSIRSWLVATLGAMVLLVSTPSIGGHSWSTYHWARTAHDFNLTIVNSTTSDWDGYVRQAVYDWSASIELNMVESNSSVSKKIRRSCPALSGQVRICNLAYGKTRWVGLAGISVVGGHITSGYTKLNDTYFNTAFYNNDAWKQSVTCQELGHNVGLGHQDEDFNNTSLLSCMDYQNPPYEYPNGHDYAQLETMYAHLDSFDSYVTGGDSGDGETDGCNAPPGKGCNKARGETNNGANGWGASLGRRGQHETFMRIDADGTRHITYVTWAIGH